MTCVAGICFIADGANVLCQSIVRFVLNWRLSGRRGRTPEPSTPKARAQAPVRGGGGALPLTMPLWRIYERVRRSGLSNYSVVDDEGWVVGTIAVADLPTGDAREFLGWLVAADVMAEAGRQKPEAA
jgi:hypothetical protein